MEQLPSSSNSKQKNQKRLEEEEEFNSTEWALKARNGITRENTFSRRFSSSNLRSFREDTRSFRSNFTISSTASSPGYSLKDEIDPSTYSFTTALKALQARTGCVWECLSPDGLALNSKWNEAEKYICNPLSGEVPMECLSAKTLSGRSLHSFTSRITMSAPLFYPSQLRHPQSNPSPPTFPEKKIGVAMKTVAGTQSTPAELSPDSVTPTSNSPKVEVKEAEEKKEEKAERRDDDEKEGHSMCRWKEGGGCLSFSLSWMRKKQKDKNKNKNNPFSRKRTMFLVHMSGC